MLEQESDIFEGYSRRFWKQEVRPDRHDEAAQAEDEEGPVCNLLDEDRSDTADSEALGGRSQ